MAGPSNVIALAFAQLTTSVVEIWAAPADNDYMVSVRLTNTTGDTVLGSLAVAPTGTDVGSIPAANWSPFDFECEANKPYDLEDLLEIPEGWSIFGRGSTVGLNVRVSGRKKEVS